MSEASAGITAPPTANSAPRRRSRTPAPRLLWAVFALLLLGLGAALLPLALPGAGPALERGWQALAAALLVVAAWDFHAARRVPPLRPERDCPANIPVNRWVEVALTLHHEGAGARQLQWRECVSERLASATPTLTIALQAQRYTTVHYRVRARQRGAAAISGGDALLPSPLGLWQTVWRYPLHDAIKVYPDFTAINGYNLLATDNHVSQLGIRSRQRRGEGLEFLQLRDYRRGDTLRQIDWKATARRQALIAKEYQDERDQQVVILLDNGRRMRAVDAGLSHFDQAINAMTLLAYVALRQGDAVGVMSFGSTERWFPCRKGQSTINAILNHVYDVQPGLSASDYSAAAQRLLAFQRKRALVIVMTNTRDEDIDDLRPALKLLRQHHLVVLANLHEPALQQALQQPVRNLDDAYRYTGTVDYLARRQDMQRQLQADGTQVVDSAPRELPVKVVNRYLAIKRGGSL